MYKAMRLSQFLWHTHTHTHTYSCIGLKVHVLGITHEPVSSQYKKKKQEFQVCFY